MKNEELGHRFGIVNNEISKVDILRISLPYPEKMCSDTPWEPLPPTGLYPSTLLDSLHDRNLSQ